VARYRDIAVDLKHRIASGEFGDPGDRLPTISDLMAHYGVPGLNTIRQAQQLLVDDGLSKPVRAWVRSSFASSRCRGRWT
jgi:DNA-binding GntR family transcriptional regulator